MHGHLLLRNRSLYNVVAEDSDAISSSCGRGIQVWLGWVFHAARMKVLAG